MATRIDFHQVRDLGPNLGEFALSVKLLDGSLVGITKAAGMLGCSPKIVRLLVVKYAIPIQPLATAKYLDEGSMCQLREAYAEYRNQPNGQRWQWLKSA